MNIFRFDALVYFILVYIGKKINLQCYLISLSMQVGKGRDVGLNQIALFEGKVAGGNGEQVLSRDVYRLGQLFDFFRMLSFYFTTVGYYVCTMVCLFLLLVLSLKTILNQVANLLVYLTRNVSLIQMTVLTVYVFLYGRAYLVIYRTSFLLSWFDQLLLSANLFYLILI